MNDHQRVELLEAALARVWRDLSAAYGAADAGAVLEKEREWLRLFDQWQALRSAPLVFVITH